MHVNIHVNMPISLNIYLYKLFLNIPSSYLKCTIHCCCALSVQDNSSLEFRDLCFSSCGKYIILTNKTTQILPRLFSSDSGSQPSTLRFLYSTCTWLPYLSLFTHLHPVVRMDRILFHCIYVPHCFPPLVYWYTFRSFCFLAIESMITYVWQCRCFLEITDIISKPGIWSLGHKAIQMSTLTSHSSSWQIVIFSPLNCLSFKFAVLFINSEYYFGVLEIFYV